MAIIESISFLLFCWFFTFLFLKFQIMMNALIDDLVFQCINKVAIIVKLHFIDIISINKI